LHVQSIVDQEREQNRGEAKLTGSQRPASHGSWARRTAVIAVRGGNPTDPAFS